MSIDAKQLLAYTVEDIHQTYTPKDCAFYALSVGLGLDPLDERRLAFVDPNRGAGQLVLPSMALVLGYPGFWLVRPHTTIDPTRILHGTQSVVWHRPLPTKGDVTGKTRITQLIDRGEGKHGMIVSERDIIDTATGGLYATLKQIHVLRGQGGFGGDTDPLPPPHQLPRIEPAWFIDVPTGPDQALLYRLNGDLFALHADPEMARKSGFQRPILHGMCVAGIATQVLMRLLAKDDPSRLKSIEMRFSAPIYPGETVRIEAWADGSFRARCVERDEIILDNGLMRCN
ncbi:MaoC/PaaZ C-terminal domain-containing protein [Rhizobium leguminosarum]|uniref:MaoC/PaaZ C-terminal domain-containing protein n=1 Tax=Rhizobium TaxID=379 RepID=UPI001C937E46|nr:MaoC/PaaZ C-terminal domain-containing protein [Rhizobium leguminosarum]MBY5392850.1 3-alpha,7-alpha,12-alpha-trihydroxy-5-beta-cholest-24-enoyl-CoA hydratase [Rhizobium leguminosarum]MBY5434482.1 3-alpha,7-alpha,12-alpha-trihydroxy-5-beta-cholest-24-enoyl-CoA hydratase [Rhizobium leguminosarum]